MAPSFDCTVSSLLCAEDNIFDDNDFGSVRLEGEFEEAMWPLRNHRNYDQNRGFDAEGGLPLPSDEYLASMVEKECHHLPGSDYLMRLQSGDLDLGARKQAVDWIGKANAHFSFGPLCQYLSINYLDRFLSAYELPERVVKCVNLIHDMSLMSGAFKDASGSAQSVPRSPIGVLDAACFSYKSEESTVGSCANSFHNSSDSKRRKLNRAFEV
ncbi:cyclin-D2-1-like [Prunus yedoensis var. nudiflora]|uniref:B-like cyclin n=1 Tax=Prunus yedoensis var. nudiflora TaxID=2094558 RepID=A0A314UP23_PRUYE|nr:cyclin-D2-1-like [Prunus yedoensis var. nudiflora]